MTHPTGNDDPRVVTTINEAIRLVAASQEAAAVELLAKLTADFPLAASVRGYLAWFLMKCGRTNEAIEVSREAVQLAPQSELVSLVHFHVLWRSGRQLDALEEMKRFLLIRPSSEYASMVKDWELE